MQMNELEMGPPCVYLIASHVKSLLRWKQWMALETIHRLTGYYLLHLCRRKKKML